MFPTNGTSSSKKKRFPQQPFFLFQILTSDDWAQ